MTRLVERRQLLLPRGIPLLQAQNELVLPGQSSTEACHLLLQRVPTGSCLRQEQTEAGRIQ
jgi:hypothetical protein